MKFAKINGEVFATYADKWAKSSLYLDKTTV